MLQKNHYYRRMISLILMVTMMLSPFSMVSYAEETGE